MYQALYRKWRPQTFDDLIGQEPITTTLKNQVAAKTPSHAYLFCGSRGTGKTSCAKILAKAVNCLAPEQGNPCGVCAICIGIEKESILDVTEIDAASNSGVDNIRELREEANFTPISCKYRVYIIDEAHMLSTGAFNALLKIMEEPPPHVLFILATTEIHKVPATILSRCQRFDFRRLPSALMATRLLEIAGAEQATLTPDAAHLIARLSDGAMRDALSLLDLCMTTEEDITLDLVESRSGLAGQEYLNKIAAAALEEDGGKALVVLHELWQYSVDYSQFCGQLLGFYRNMLVVNAVPDPTELLEGMTPHELEELKASTQGYSLSRIFYSIAVLSDTLNRMYRTPMRRTEMEMGLLKLCNPAMDSSADALLLRLEKLESSSQQVVPQVVPQVVQQVVPQVVPARAEQKKPLPIPSDPPAQPAPPPENTGEPPTTAPTPGAERTAEESTAEGSTAEGSTAEENTAQAVPFEPWFDVLNILQTKNKALYGSLFYSKAFIQDDLLLIDAGGELFAEIIRTDDYARESLRSAVETITGRVYRLGPYQATEFSAVQPKGNPLDALAEAAEGLGVSIDVKD